jgi:hypothetical protein
MLIQRILHPLHHSQNLLLFQPASDNLHCNRQARHLLRIVMLVRALRHAVESLEVKYRWQSVLEGVDVRYRDDAGGVIELRDINKGE